MTQIPVIFILAFLTTADCSGQNIVAYYKGNGQNIEQYPIAKISHLIYSFCYLKGKRLAASRRDSFALHKLVLLKNKFPSLKILVAIGGWGGCKTCSAVFATEEGRSAFVQSVADLTNYFNTDGLDVDWEFPSVDSYPGQSYLPTDKDHIAELFEMLRKKLGPSKELSFVAAGFSPYLQQSVNWKRIMAVADRVNLMTYDIIGSRSPVTGHNAALYSDSFQQESADHAVHYLDSLGVPPLKIAIGVAFYAREWAQVPGTNHGLHQPGRFARFLSMKQVRRLCTEGTGYKEYWDDTVQAPYCYNAARGLFLSYDNARSVAAKAAYVRNRRLNGIMFWELQLDKAHGGLTDDLYNALHSDRAAVKTKNQ